MVCSLAPPTVLLTKVCCLVLCGPTHSSLRLTLQYTSASSHLTTPHHISPHLITPHHTSLHDNCTPLCATSSADSMPPHSSPHYAPHSTHHTTTPHITPSPVLTCLSRDQEQNQSSHHFHCHCERDSLCAQKAIYTYKVSAIR